jgi:hypothetical protein
MAVTLVIRSPGGAQHAALT